MLIVDPKTSAVMSEYEFRLANPTISFPAVLTADNVTDHGGAVLTETQPQTFDAATQYPATDGAELVDGVWTQKWLIKTFTPEELAARQPPSVAERLASAGLTLDELKAALGL